ncbi:chemocyanin [Lolium perenne]|uniref:chemocyanin n=1 Tax=Lolium perenne TaxID=4522 RepID=UPI0021EA45B1|nr:uclacyanin-3-like [Lolium perenne]
MAGRGLLLAAGLVLLAAAAPAAYAVDYTVGDSSGWTGGVDYSTWASDKTFNVGDTLVFQYGASHNVAEVGSADYSACSSTNSIQSYSDQDSKIKLTKPGTRYFICAAAGHCAGGMKLAVTVAPAATSTPTPTAPAATPAAPSETPSETSPDPETPSTSTTPAATTTNTPASGKTADSVGGASGMEARSVMGALVGAAGLVGLALMG